MSEFVFRPLIKWPRSATPAARRKRNPFHSDYGSTLRLLRSELYKLSARTPIMIQVALHESDIRQDGLPRADARIPTFPGVLVAFTGRHGPLQFLCDDCWNWHDNLRAIALTLERLRLADLYGVTKAGEQYAGWKQLPPPIALGSSQFFATIDQAAAWIAQLAGVTVARVLDDREIWRRAYRTLAATYHPDRNSGQLPPEWTKLQEATWLIDQHFSAVAAARAERNG